jgi:hypothetical protein
VRKRSSSDRIREQNENWVSSFIFLILTCLLTKLLLCNIKLWEIQSAESLHTKRKCHSIKSLQVLLLALKLGTGTRRENECLHTQVRMTSVECTIELSLLNVDVTITIAIKRHKPDSDLLYVTRFADTLLNKY